MSFISPFRAILAVLSFSAVFSASIVLAVPSPIRLLVDSVFISRQVFQILAVMSACHLIAYVLATNNAVGRALSVPLGPPKTRFNLNLLISTNAILMVLPYISSTILGCFLLFGRFSILLLLPLAAGMSLTLLSVVYRVLSGLIHSWRHGDPRLSFRQHVIRMLPAEGAQIAVLTVLLLSFAAGHLRIAHLSQSGPVNLGVFEMGDFDNMSVIGGTSHGLLFMHPIRKGSLLTSAIFIQKNLFLYRDDSGFQIWCVGADGCWLFD